MSFLYYFLEAPPLYLICWNQSQVSDWIDKLVTEDYYNETLVLETLKPVNQDVSTKLLHFLLCSSTLDPVYHGPFVHSSQYSGIQCGFLGQLLRCRYSVEGV